MEKRAVPVLPWRKSLGCSLQRKKRIEVPRDLDVVTTRDSAGEVDPREVDMTRDGVEAIWRAVERLYQSGLQPAIALCVRRHGRVVLNRAIGHARGNGPGEGPEVSRVLATPQTPFCIFSASKAVTAMLIHHLDDQGKIHIDDRVSEYIPEFARHGKEAITIRHVLTHRAGIPSVAGHNALEELLDWDRIVQLLCEAEPTWPPGRRLAYHAITGGFILGEIVRRVTRKDIRQYLRDEVLVPLGMRLMNYGVPPEMVSQVARNYFTGNAVPFPISLLVKRALGVSFREACELSNDPIFLTSIIPAGNIVATAEEVSRFYQLLLNEGELDGKRIFDPRTVRRAINESSHLEIDLTLALPIRYGLGLMLGDRRLSLFGPNTPRAFGHVGFIQVLTWADPDRRVAVGFLTSGKPFFGLHLRHTIAVLQAISRHCAVVKRP
jgi:CubicO group peptidase (beta-lactamase class C family)